MLSCARVQFWAAVLLHAQMSILFPLVVRLALSSRHLPPRSSRTGPVGPVPGAGLTVQVNGAVPVVPLASVALAILARSLRITPQRVRWRMRSCWQGRADGFTDRFSYSYHIAIDLRNANVQHSRHRRYPLYIRARGHPGRASHRQPRTPSAKSPDLLKPAGRPSTQTLPACVNQRRAHRRRSPQSRLTVGFPS